MAIIRTVRQDRINEQRKYKETEITEVYFSLSTYVPLPPILETALKAFQESS